MSEWVSNWARAPITAVLTAAMALPMFLLYATGVLGPEIVSELGVSRSELGLLTSVCFAVAAALSLWAGQVVDRIGVRTACVWLFLIVGVSFALIAISRGFALLAFGVAVCGIAQALANPTTNKVIALSVPPERRGSTTGTKQSGVQLAALVAGAALPLAAPALGWRGAVAAAIPVALLFAAAAWVLVPGTGPAVRNRAWRPARPTARLAWLMGFQLCLGGALASLTTFLPLYVSRDLHSSHGAWMIAGFGVVGVVARIGWTSLAGRLDRLSGLLAALAVGAAASAVSVWAARFGGVSLAWIGALGMAATAVAANAVSMLAVIRDRSFGEVAPASALVSSAFFAGFVLSPPLTGAIADTAAGFGGAWLLVPAELLVAAACTAGLRAGIPAVTR